MFQWLTAKARRWRMRTLKPFGKAAGGLRNQPRGPGAPRRAGVGRRLRGRRRRGGGRGQPAGPGLRRRRQPGQQLRGHGRRHRQGHRRPPPGQGPGGGQAAIAGRFLGELPVGMALVVELPGPPVCRSWWRPRPCGFAGSVADTINAYLAMRAALVAVLLHGKAIRSLAVAGPLHWCGRHAPRGGRGARCGRPTTAWSGAAGGRSSPRCWRRMHYGGRRDEALIHTIGEGVYSLHSPRQREGGSCLPFRALRLRKSAKR